MIRGVIFDLDGTLVDTLEDLAGTMNHLLRRDGYPVHPVEDYRYFVGRGILNTIREALPEAEAGRAESYLDDFTAFYEGHCLDATRPYEGIPELLEDLRTDGYALAVVTNKNEALARRIVGALFPGFPLELVRGARPGCPLKPDPRGALETVTALGLKPREIVMAGDSGVDMETACGAGFFPCGVLWGYRAREELAGAGAQFFADHPREVGEFVRSKDPFDFPPENY